MAVRQGNLFIGKGSFNPHSAIMVRILSRKNDTINKAFFAAQIGRALDYRKEFLKGETSFRVIFGEADGLPGLIVDKFSDYLVMQINTLGMDTWRNDIVDVLAQVVHPKGIYAKMMIKAPAKNSSFPRTAGFLATGPSSWCPFEINGLHIGKIGAVGALVVLAIAPIFLLIDLTQPLRFWHLFSYINWRSAITWGTFFLTAYPPIGVIYAICVLRGNYSAAKIWGLCGFPIAISVHGYTGFILALAKGRAFWNNPLNPILFLVSAMVSGLALMIIILHIRKRVLGLQGEQEAADSRITGNLVTMMFIFLIIELFLMGSDLAVLAHSGKDEYEMFHLLTEGDFAPLFLGVELILGGLIPLTLLSIKRIRLQPLGQCAACALILCGILAKTCDK